MTGNILVVYTNPVEGREDEYNEWYTKRHLADVLRVDGMSAAQRYSLREVEGGPASPTPTHRYLSIYEVEGDPLAAIASLSKAAKAGMEISPALAPGSAMYLYEPLTERVTSVSIDGL